MPRLRRIVLAGLFAVFCAAVLWAGWNWWNRSPLTRGGPWVLGRLAAEWERTLGAQRIESTRIEVALSPVEKRLSATAVMRIQVREGAAGAVNLLLNPGLVIESVECEGRALRVKRRGNTLTLSTLEGGATHDVTLRYAGTPDAAVLQAPVIRPEEWLLPMFSFWYPLDLSSFSNLEGHITYPAGMKLVHGGVVLEESEADGVKSTAFREVRPVIGAALALGNYKEQVQTAGSTRATVRYTSGNEQALTALAQDLCALENYYRSIFGEDRFTGLQAVTSDAISEAHYGGNGILMLPELGSRSAPLPFADLARLVAQNWWGHTVGGRWFTTRPDGGEWLQSGLAEYSAWRALRHLRGQRPYLQYREEGFIAWDTDQPLSQVNMLERFRADTADAAPLRQKGGAICAMLAGRIGRETFDTVCANFLEVHRYSVVSHHALVHELEMVAEIDLQEFFRQWLDTVHTVDLAIASVRNEPGRVLIEIQDAGRIVWDGPMEIAVETDAGITLHQVRAEDRTTTIALPAATPATAAWVDPFLEIGDLNRANNRWPARLWLTGVEASASGEVLLRGMRQWQPGREDVLLKAHADEQVPAVPFALPEPGNPVVTWRHDGAATIGTAHPVLWHGDAITRLPVNAGHLQGWVEDRIWFSNDVNWVSMTGTGQDMIRVPLGKQPVAGSFVHAAATGAWLFRESGTQIVWYHGANHEERAVPGADGAHAAPRWEADGQSAVIVDPKGRILRWTVGEATSTTVLDLSYPLRLAALSASGHYAAWLDPANTLRLASLQTPQPLYVPLEGDIVDFAWMGDEQLVVLTAGMPAQLPMRMHSRMYVHWIDAATLRVQSRPAPDAVELLANAATVAAP
ncbi:MAG: hypothetical protein HYV27_17400 [Candidatus Hydrogenedentes bacterium]|nr:hypothetical protein [Candidatus Hydrogenedentota bacterium]